MEIKKEKCYFCEKKLICIKEDIGGLIKENNINDVCLNCAITDKLRRFNEGDLCLLELENEIKELFEALKIYSKSLNRKI